MRGEGLDEKRHVSYGLLERDESAIPVGRVAHGWDGREFVVWEWPIRRRRFEFWHDEQGRKWGRWTWEYL